MKNNEQVSKDAENKKQLQEIVVGGAQPFQGFPPRRHPAPHPAALDQPLSPRHDITAPHVDDALMGSGNKERTDVSVTVFINDATRL